LCLALFEQRGREAKRETMRGHRRPRAALPARIVEQGVETRWHASIARPRRFRAIAEQLLHKALAEL